eukprot:2235163-Pyramimonas_sp.AAC.1
MRRRRRRRRKTKDNKNDTVAERPQVHSFEGFGSALVPARRGHGWHVALLVFRVLALLLMYSYPVSCASANH